MRRTVWEPPATHGNERVVRRFLFLPLTLRPVHSERHERRWLEWAYVIERFDSGDDHAMGGWIPVNWSTDW